MNRTGTHGLLVRLKLLLLTVLITGCTAMGQTRLNTEGPYQNFDFPLDTPWADFRAELHELLLQNWQELYPGAANAEHVQAIVAAHMPTDTAPANCNQNARPRAMLLIHGLYDSPFVMQDLEEVFRQHCFHTRSLLLPGHGTRPGSLLNPGYQEWLKAVDYAVHSLRREVSEEVYITGFSTGATLALHHTLHHPEQVQGLFLFAPALDVPGNIAGIVSPFFNWVPFQISQLSGDTDQFRYEAQTMNSVVQIELLSDEVSMLLDQPGSMPEIPVLLVLTENDATIPSRLSLELFARRRFGEESILLLYSPANDSGACTEEYPEDTALIGRPGSTLYLNSCFFHASENRSYQIADYAHTSLLLGPDNPQYGLEGEYRYCSQYYTFFYNNRRLDCLSRPATEVCFGERRNFGSAVYRDCAANNRTVRRLTSNPRFDELSRHIGEFVQHYLGKP